MGILLLVAVSLAAIASVAVLLSFDSTSAKLLKRMDQIMYDISGVQASADALNVAVTDLQTTVGQMETNIDHLLLAINDPLDHDATASAFVIKQLNGISAALTETSRSLVAFHAPIIAPVTNPVPAPLPVEPPTPEPLPFPVTPPVEPPPVVG